VFAVQGDTESVAGLRNVVAGTPVRALVNENVTVRVRDRVVSLTGIERAYGSPGARAAARRLERAPGGGDIRILLAHRPDAVFRLRPGTRVDLTAAGHTHGGQVQLPLIGPPVIASKVPRAVGAGGLHELDGRRIYVTRGVGVERDQAPRLRFGSVPEVSILTLR
jgi:predicted MPP superfamily phosphohydrolase